MTQMLVEESKTVFLFTPMVSWIILSLNGNQCSSLLNRVRDKFFAMVDSGMKNWDDRESRDILRSILMTTCDVAAITKPWEIQRKVKISFVCINRFLCQPYFNTILLSSWVFSSELRSQDHEFFLDSLKRNYL